MLYVLYSHAIYLSFNSVIIDLDAINWLIININIIYFWEPSSSYHHYISTILPPSTKTYQQTNNR